MEKTIRWRIDDVDGSTPADRTVQFSLGREHYEIDLTEEHVTKMGDDFAHWIAHARPIRNPYKRKKNDTETPSQIRAWARLQGVEVSDKGRIPNSVVEAYRQRGEQS